MKNWEIKQDLEHRYLVCAVRQSQEDYRVRMLVNQTTAPLLACRTRRVNGELLLAYDVSSLRSLAQLCETESAGAGLLRTLFAAIGGAYERLQSYLLEPDMLLLDPEAIFCEAGNHTFFFCCTLAAENDSFASLHALSRFLLEVLDQEDERALRLGYALYRSSLPEQLKQAEVMRLLRADTGEEETEPPARSTEAEHEQEAEAPAWPVEAEVEIEREEGKASCVEVRAQEQETEWKSGTYKEVPSAAPDKEEKPRRKRQARTFFHNLFGGRREEQPYFPSPYAGAGTLPSYAGEKLFAYGGKSCVLQGQKKELPTFSPAEYPFLIGSLEFGVDGYIDDVTVSRFHAKLEKTEGRYYLTDLDSAHGTKRNGEPLPPQTKVELQNGDEIRFGRTRFRFAIQ